MSAATLIDLSRKLADDLGGFHFSAPVSHTYNPLVYARAPHELYLNRFGSGKKRVFLLGMNPGPYGMAQTGVPFGEISAVRDWMGITAPVGKPILEHPKRPIDGFACMKSEVSGRRLWGLFSEKFPKPEHFFAHHYVANYCPLIWMSTTGANLTPDKLSTAEMEPIEAICLDHLTAVIRLLEPVILIGIGGFAEARLHRAAEKTGGQYQIGRILHPSPASPAANRGWAQAAEKQLKEQGVWSTP